MPNSYKLKLSSLNQDGLKEVIETLEVVFEAFKVDFYIIGALARDVWFSKEKIKSRATKDVGLAVFILKPGAYEEIKSTLIEKHNFKEVKTNAFALLTPYGYPVDLLPFGSVEIDEAVEIEGEGLTNVHVNGFKEIYQHGIAPILTEDGITFKIASLASIVLLKLIAYDDRPEIRTQDIKDVAIIINHYFHVESDLIYEKHNDLFENEDLELVDIAAIVIGREMKSILNTNEALKDRVLGILSLTEKQLKKIPELMAQTGKFSMVRWLELLKRIQEAL
jgi:predicted nucleotidyltransferase